MASNYDRFLNDIKRQNDDNIKKAHEELSKMTTALVIVEPKKLVINKPKRVSQREKIVKARNIAQNLSQELNQHVEALDVYHNNDINLGQFNNLIDWDETQDNNIQIKKHQQSDEYSEINDLVNELTEDIENIIVDETQPLEIKQQNNIQNNDMNKNNEKKIKNKSLLNNDKVNEVDDKIVDNNKVNEVDDKIVDNDKVNKVDDNNKVDDKVNENINENKATINHKQNENLQVKEKEGFFSKFKKLFK